MLPLMPQSNPERSSKHRPGSAEEVNLLFRQVVEHIREVFWMYDPQAQSVVYVSPAYETIWQRSCESLYRATDSWMDDIHPGDKQRIGDAWQTKCSTELFNQEYRLVRPDGSVRWIQDRAFPVKDDSGQVYRIAGIAEDITERKKREHQLRSLADVLHRTEEHERKRLAADLHDNLAQLLALAKLKVQTLNQHHPASRLSEIESTIDEALAYTRSLMNELRPALFGGSDDLVTAVTWVMNKMTRHGLSVTLHDDGSPKPLDDDVLTLGYQTVQELLWNVLKHSHTRQAGIAITQDDAFVSLRVEDEGVGFDPLARLQGPRTGCGFGLFSIRERVDLINGEMTVQSRPGHGTTVTVRLPKKLEAGGKHGTIGAQTPSDSPIARNDPGAPKIRVLLVDDHSMIREGLRTIIESQPDLEVVGEAADGERAIALTRQTSPHVILMDVQMPVMDGIEATRQIKKEFPQVCIIGLSFLEDDRTATAMREAGAVAYLSKGKSFDTLYHTIRLVSNVLHSVCH